MTKMDTRVLLARLAKMTGTLSGLDACLMLAQYSSPFIIALLLRLSRLRSSLASGTAEKLSQEHSVLGTIDGVKNVAGAVGDARAVMRAFGLVPVLLALTKLHPRPLHSLKSFGGVLSSPKAVPTVQALSLVGFYSMDHLTWLAGKGLLSLDTARIKQLGLWGTRCWALYVLLELYKLNQTYSALRTRTRAAKLAKPVVSPREAEGYEIPDIGSSTSVSEKTGTSVHLDKDRLRRDWDEWRLASLTNWSFAPLTLHWSVDGGLWSNPVITYSLGSMAALGRVASSWTAAEI